MEALVQRRKSLVLILVKQTQNFVQVCIIILIIVICLSMEQKSLSLKPTIKMLIFQLSFFSEIYLDLVLISITGFSATESRNVSLNG